LLHNL